MDLTLSRNHIVDFVLLLDSPSPSTVDLSLTGMEGIGFARGDLFDSSVFSVEGKESARGGDFLKYKIREYRRENEYTHRRRNF
jgi:hypothetical protein